jgi:hypothetical protein
VRIFTTCEKIFKNILFVLSSHNRGVEEEKISMSMLRRRGASSTVSRNQDPNALVRLQNTPVGLAEEPIIGQINTISAQRRNLCGIREVKELEETDRKIESCLRGMTKGA